MLSISNHDLFLQGMGGCEVRNLPDVKNAKRILVRPFRGSVVKYKCHNGFKILGEEFAYCADHNTWSLQEAPVCTRKLINT